MARPRRARMAAVAALLLAVGGCTAHHDTSGAADNGSAQVVAARGGVVKLRGVTVAIPAGALSADATVSASYLDPPAAPPGAAVAAGDAVRIEIGAADLATPIEVTFPLRTRPATADAAGLAYFDPATGGWTPVPARVDIAAGTITATVSHLSWWQPWTWDLTGLQTTMAALLTPVASFRADLPHCGSAPAGVKLTIDGGRAGDPALDGCVEAAGAGLRVKLVNNRSYATVVGSPTQARFESGTRGGLYDALLQQVGQDKLGGYYLPAGGTVSYLTARTGGDVYFNSGPNLLTFMITTAADFALTLVPSKAIDKAHAAGQAAVDATTLDAGVLTGVGKCLADTAAAQPPASPVEAVRLTLGCLDLIAKGALHTAFLAPLGVLQTLIVPIAAAYDIGQDSAAAGTDSHAVLVRAAPGPACTAAAFAPHDGVSGLVGYRCAGRYAAVVTASPMGGGGADQANAVIYVAHGSSWKATVYSGGGVYIPVSEFTKDGLDAHAVAAALNLTIENDAVYVSALGCNGKPADTSCLRG